jgi:hypothetical protein
VLATDDPFVHEIVTEARIVVSAVRVHRDSQADSGFLTIYDGPPLDLDLLDLRDGVTAQLADADLPAGSYGQIRLVIESASLTLTNGNVYSTDLGNLNLTSTGKSGLKIFVSPPIVITSGLASELLLDFDLTKSFHPVPASDPLAAATFLLMPVVKASNTTSSGDIQGVVTMSDGAGGQVGVNAATVYVLPPGETDTANAVASSSSIADGSYAVLGLAAGTYDVLATSGTLQGRVDGIVVVAGNSTTVDILVQ